MPAFFWRRLKRAFEHLAEIRIFAPILAGATLRDRLFACGGAVVCVGLTAVSCTFLGDLGVQHLMLIAPIGASAVLMCAVPSSPLAQPWSIIGGNTVSAISGIAVAGLVHDPALAAGTAVAVAIAGMTFLRCLHPPGGAVALMSVMAGASAPHGGFGFALAPVALDSTILVGLGWAFHQFSHHTYPHRPVVLTGEVAVSPAAQAISTPGFIREDVEGALADFGEAFDIDEEDLEALLHRVELRALARRQG